MATYAVPLRVPADVGLALQEARRDQGLSQSELAERLDLPQSVVSQMETGAGTIYLRRLLEMARSLGIELTASWSDPVDNATEQGGDGREEAGS